MYPHVGQTVYLKCAVNGTHRGYGRITGFDGLEFTIEALGGEFYNGEAVYVYLEDDMESADRIGKGTVVKPLAETVRAEGVIAEMFVSEGERVEAGQLLFSLAVGAAPGEADNVLKSPVAGYVTEVLLASGGTAQAGQILARVCPAEELIVEFALGEQEIAPLCEGAAVTLAFSQGEEPVLLPGEISRISYLPVSSGDGMEIPDAQAGEEEALYCVAVAFDPGEEAIRPGMRAGLLFP